MGEYAEQLSAAPLTAKQLLRKHESIRKHFIPLADMDITWVQIQPHIWTKRGRWIPPILKRPHELIRSITANDK